MWEQITAMVAQEFSDLPDTAEATRIVLRLALAALLGGLLGIEREAKGKAAGVRTHMMVAMGAAMFVLASLQFDIQPADMSRVLQGVIAGVGFLGAGTILKGDAESQVKGLTTAAGIWMTAAIGVAAGMGKEATAVLATLLTLAIMASLPLITALFERKDADAGRAVRPDDPP
jgi:putative Mg2+ transporter-C (MgtC) family protein